MTTSDSAKTDPGLRGYRRSRTSTRFVRWSDRIAKHVITIGGIGTILVVLMVVVVLLGNVAPLFRGASVSPLTTIDLSKAPVGAKPLDGSKPLGVQEPIAFGLDEYNELVWFLHPDRHITVRSVQSTELLAEFPIDSNGSKPSSSEISAVSVDAKNAHILIGYQDGSVQPVSIAIEVGFRKLSDMPTEVVESLKQGSAVRGGSVFRLTSGNLVRETRVSEVVAQESIPLFKAPVSSLDCLLQVDESGFEESTQWVYGASDGVQTAMGVLKQKPAMLGGGIQTESQIWRNTAATADIADSSRIVGVMVTSRADAIRSIDRLGEVRWWTPVESEQLTLKQSYLTITGSESKTTCAAPLLGGVSWLIGGRSGHVESVTVAATDSGQELLSIHRIPTIDAPITALASAPNNRMFAALSDSGTIALRYTTSESELARWDVSPGPRATNTGLTDDAGNFASLQRRLQFNASGNTLALLDEERLSIWGIEAAFPEASISSFFAPVWYEGYRQPSHIWQSSTGSAEGEPKFGMWPLIFGTLKATFYSMLIAAPIALLAAIFGSEFMSKTWRLRFKPLIELMASVPSVVLGFIGALVLAPLLRDYLSWFLLSGIMTMFLFVLAAHLWMMLPVSRAIPLRRYRLPLMFLVPPIAVAVSWLAYPTLERFLFQTSLVDWLSNGALGAWPGWFMLMLLPMVLLVVWIATGPLRSLIEVCRGGLPVRFESMGSLLTFLFGTVVAILLAGLSATIITSTGLDARGTIVGPYQERNALLVGGILGFAIIPLVYTLADDALQSVPQHLRSASLGCGATVWQTTVRVVVPTAMSGLFSALMIGFGRAIGETMVVLMAAGNTPLMEINPFNGYRTLSATLATELPEAARGSTHYHTLFLAALLLFCFTLIVNTCAEWVRIRFRKRAFQL